MSKLRNWFSDAGLIVAGAALLAFLAGSVLWFIRAAKNNGTIAAGNAFVGLGYMAGALLIVLLAIVGLRLLAVDGAAPPRRPARSPRPRRADDEHAIIRMQLAWGSTLVIVGAVVGLLCLCILHRGSNGPVLALATAVISAGAVLLPAGAAGGASARLLQQQQSGDVTVAPPDAPEVTRTSDSAATLRGTLSPTTQDVDAYFEFQDMPAEDATVEAAVAQTQPPHHILAGAAAQSVTDDLTTLDAAKVYRVRLVIRSATGATVKSDWSTLPTFAAPETPAPETPAPETPAPATPAPDAGGTGEADDTASGDIGDTGVVDDPDAKP